MKQVYRVFSRSITTSSFDFNIFFDFVFHFKVLQLHRETLAQSHCIFHDVPHHDVRVRLCVRTFGAMPSSSARHGIGRCLFNDDANDTDT